MSRNLLLKNINKLFLIKKFSSESYFLSNKLLSRFNLVQLNNTNYCCCCNIRFIRSLNSNSKKVYPFDINFIHIRNKHDSIRRSGSKNSEEDFDSDDEFEDFKDERDSKVVKTRVNSLRADLIVKAGLGIARNKVETIFYESKVRVNGLKIPKKSIQLNIGDEIDVIRGFSNVNPTHLMVSRVIILSATEKEENILVNLRRYKNLVIENYEGSNQFK